MAVKEALSQPIGELLERATLSVLETMFMTSIDSPDGSTGRFEKAKLRPVCLRFEGARRGEMRLLLEDSTARSLASTMLGLEPEELEERHAVQLAGELANMICGCLLSHLEPDGILSLDAPRRVDDAQPLTGATSRIFSLPEGILQVEFRLDPAEV